MPCSPLTLSPFSLPLSDISEWERCSSVGCMLSSPSGLLYGKEFKLGSRFLLPSLLFPLISCSQAFRAALSHVDEVIPSHEQDIPLHVCSVILLCCIIPFYILVSLFMSDWLYTLLLSFFVIIFGFFASAVAAYMAGLVGSSNNPISGVTVCVVLVTASVLRLYLGSSPLSSLFPHD
jgi:uncharacterized oligopeptide transporter (OPT) family protein